MHVIFFILFISLLPSLSLDLCPLLPCPVLFSSPFPPSLAIFRSDFLHIYEVIPLIIVSFSPVAFHTT